MMHEFSFKIHIQITNHINENSDNHSEYVRQILEKGIRKLKRVSGPFVTTTCTLTQAQGKFVDRYKEFGFLSQSDFMRYLILHRPYSPIKKSPTPPNAKREHINDRRAVYLPQGCLNALERIKVATGKNRSETIRERIAAAMETIQPIAIDGFKVKNYSASQSQFEIMEKIAEYGFMDRADFVRTILYQAIIDRNLALPQAHHEEKKATTPPITNGKWVRCATGERILLPPRTKCVSQ